MLKIFGNIWCFVFWNFKYLHACTPTIFLLFNFDTWIRKQNAQLLMKMHDQCRKTCKFFILYIIFLFSKKKWKKDGIRPQKGQVVVATLLILDVSRLAVIYNCYFLTVDMLQTWARHGDLQYTLLPINRAIFPH